MLLGSNTLKQQGLVIDYANMALYHGTKLETMPPDALPLYLGSKAADEKVPMHTLQELPSSRSTRKRQARRERVDRLRQAARQNLTPDWRQPSAIKQHLEATEDAKSLTSSNVF